MRLLTATAAVLVAAFAPFAGARCLVPNATAVPLPVGDNPAYGLCPPGYHCPNATRSDPTTWPAFCPPTEACVLMRADNEYCPPQGWYEPVPCGKGFYCPNASTRLVCPAGSWCPFGSVAPRTCGPLSRCPEGSAIDHQIGDALLMMFVVDVLALVAYLVWRRHRNQPTSVVPMANPEQEMIGLMRQALDGTKPLHFHFRNLSVKLPDSDEANGGKVLLRGVSGHIAAGRVTAIMGPSGAGKTTFFTTLLGKQPADWVVDGTLCVSGGNSVAPLRSVLAFVPQDDVLCAELTVNDNIAYSANVRLPVTWTADERDRMRSAVLEVLGLVGVRDCPIRRGSRGITNAQRKRTSVGVELVGAPAAIFLDEPTTGLDAATALELVRVLKAVACECHIPVAMVVHQPRVEIWDALDQVLLLAPGGKTVFEGSRADADEYFVRECGVDVTKANPSDVIMDAISLHGDELAAAFEKMIDTHSPLAPECNDPPPTRDQAGFVRQVALAHARAVTEHLSSPWYVALDVLLGLLGGVMLTVSVIDRPQEGTLKGFYVVLSAVAELQTNSMLVMLWFIGLAIALVPAGTRVIGHRRVQYWREASAGYSRLAFYIGASSAEVYRLTLLAFHFGAFAYLMWQPYAKYWEVLSVIVLILVCLDAQAVLIGAFLDPSIAPLLGVVIGVFTALTNGYAGVPGTFVAYPWYITTLLYNFELAPVRDIFDASQIEQEFEYVLGRSWFDVLVVLLWFVGLRLLGFVVMSTVRRDKQR